MKYLLDTNAVIAILNANERFLTTLERHKEREIAISSIVLSELYYGAYKSQKTAQNLEKSIYSPLKCCNLIHRTLIKLAKFVQP